MGDGGGGGGGSICIYKNEIYKHHFLHRCYNFKKPTYWIRHFSDNLNGFIR